MTFTLTGTLAGPAELAALDQYFTPARVGTIVDSRIVEPSGMVPVTSLAAHFWVLNDSGDSARVFVVHESGRVIAEVSVTGASAVDWEDMSRGPAPGSDLPHLFVADTGNNDLSRDQGVIYRFVEPVLTSLVAGQRFASQAVDAFPFRFPDGNANCEALIVDPSSGDMYLITKRDSPAGVYRLPISVADGQVQTLVKLGTIPTSNLVTAAEPSRDGNRLLIRTYSDIYEYSKTDSVEFSQIFFGPRRILPDAPLEVKSESLCFDHRDSDYLTIDESIPAPVHRASHMVAQADCDVTQAEQAPFVFARGDVAPALPARGVRVDLADLVSLQDLVAENAGMACPDSADVNDDGRLDELDVATLADDLLRGGPPPGPFPGPGHDLTADGLGCHEDDRELLVAENAVWSFWSRPEPPPDDWVEPEFDDSGWDRGPGGVGFGPGGLGTPLTPFSSSHITLFGRTEFTVESPEALDGLLLSIDYDDGVVAFLNGVEVTRQGLGGGGFRVPFNTLARIRSGGGFLEFPICRDLLVPGANTLALQVHGRSTLLDREIYFKAALQGRFASAPVPPPSTGDEIAAVSMTLRANGPPDLELDSRVTLLCESDSAFRAVGFTVAYDPTRTTISRVVRGADANASSYFDWWIDRRLGRVTALVTVADGDAFAGGRELQIAQVVYGTIQTSAGEEIEFHLDSGPPPLELDNSVVLENGSVSIATSEPLILTVPEPKQPVIVNIVSGSGGPGSKFLIFGERLDAPGLEVSVCGQVAEYQIFSNDQIIEAIEVIEAIAPPCDQIGAATVEICTIHGCDRNESGFVYEDVGPPWIRGDATGDGRLDISDPIVILNFLFLGHPHAATCPLALDVNDDGKNDVSDAITLLGFLFLGSVDLAPPYPEPAPCLTRP